MNDLDFCRGVWYAIQMLVVELRAPSIAANIAREANFSKDKCLELQRDSGVYDEEMTDFINEEIKMIKTMKKETIKNKVFEIIKSRLFHKDTPLTMESKLVDDLLMDSLDEVELLMELEKEFGILIPDDASGRCLTVKDVVDYMTRKMEE